MPWSPTRYDLERLENTLAYERERERIERRHRGKWVTIAKGRVVAVAPTAEACVAAANRSARTANHRFLFLVGAPIPGGWRLQEKKEEAPKVEVNECKDIEQCGSNLLNKHALGKLLKEAGGKIEDDYDNDRTCVTLKGKTKCWKWQKPTDETAEIYEHFGGHALMECIEVTLDNPKTKAKKKKCVLLDTGCTGTFIHMDAANFLALASATEHPDDDQQVHGVGGLVKVRTGFVSFEIPEVDYKKNLVIVATNKDDLKAEVEKQKKAEQEKKEAEKK